MGLVLRAATLSPAMTPMWPVVSRKPQRISFWPPCCSAPVIAGSVQVLASEFPTWVVLIQAAKVEVEPRIGERSFCRSTLERPLVKLTPLPLNERALGPILPVTHAGGGVPTSVP